jgi:peptidoglycan/xylan/chitin deacetylase (PgdA/CDA1 family)
MPSVTNVLRKELAKRFSKKIAYQPSPRPIVSFTFDDFPRSALTIGGRLLTEMKFHGTYYAAMGLMGRKTILGAMFERSDLQMLLADGHELGCHTFDHLSCFRVAITELQTACQKNCQLATDLLGGYRLRNFSFPFGEISALAKSRLKSSYDTCRSNKSGINHDPVDLAFLLANPLYSCRPSVQVKQVINEGVCQKAWVVLYTHDVDRNPSPYGCTPDYFREILAFVVDSGAEVLTIAEAASRFRVRG